MKETIEKMISDGYSLRKIAKETNKSLTTIRYWVDKYELNGNFKSFKSRPKEDKGDYRTCSRCKEIKHKDNFYKRTAREDSYQPYCKGCFNTIFSNRWIERKKWAIQYKGGKCIDCNISYPESPYVIFDFHHLDFNEKDMDWSKMKLRTIESIKMELDKCELLCSNCHRIRHHKIKNPLK
jgi:hypothetical protein